MKKWSVKNIPQQDNKTVIVTGANSGIGFQVTKVLASKGARLIMACRNISKAEKASEAIRRKVAGADLSIMHLDLSSLESVKVFAEHFRKKYGRLDILVNNAGVMATPYRKTEDGFEWQLGINHLGHFALTGHLLDILKNNANSRIVTLTSIAHFGGRIHFEDLDGASWYGRMRAYRQSKLANLLFSFELDRRLKRNRLPAVSVAAHPGISSTNIVSLPFPVRQLKSLVLMSAAKGALSVLMAATDSSMKGGEYVGPRGIRQSFGYPAVIKAGKAAYDNELRELLWKVSEELTGVYYLDSK